VTFSGGGVTSTTQQVTIGSSNVKVGPRRSGDDGRRSAVPAPAGKHRRHSVWRKPPGTDSFKFNTSLFNMNLADFLVI
jgi:hypothetical protein